MMTSLLAAGLFLATAIPAAAAPYRWTDRVVVLRAATDSDPKLTRQRDLFLAEKDELRERDMVVFAIIGGKAVASIFGKAPTLEQANRLEKGALAKADAFSVTLLGKDGGVKRESDAPVQPAELFGLIDTMPMRRQEMKR